MLADAGKRRKRYVAWHDPEDGKTKDPRLEDLIERGDTAPMTPPSAQGRAIILTSGTTGTPKGAIALDAQDRSTRSPRCCR